ncbi:hypothetical protein JX265_006655 [Neoarthrinium moseri]|uniref:Major facilitator superfamily (MFS) profile domain-containing protein n=1 Tax=Neoarthrinium moseri TaxID=1658444 RepID=A0A9P9WLS1_9PEZI|nr:hypothetical protein JX266_000068 [Neoarthrinium moseri]KAI1869565.1 hypothetical protein JX265_006655 [Neoarthrinium moseri]
MGNSMELQEHVKMLDENSLADSTQEFDRQKERRVRWKTDLIVLPLLVSIHLLAQMGRSDLPNAKLAGMWHDLKLTDSDYSMISSIFLVGYLICQLPAMLIMRKVGPPVEFACAMLAWGVVTICTMKATGKVQLMILRALVGVSEAFIQGAVLYLSFWYPYNELATRGAILYSTVALAGSFNGLLGYLIERTLGGVNGWTSWQWIFFIEGCIPLLWAFVIFFLLPSTPETVKWFFKQDEKEIIIRRSRAAHNTGESKIIPRLILKVVTQPQFWGVFLIDCGSHFCATSLSNFIPSIMQGLGFDRIQTQLMTVIVYGSAFVGIITAAVIADKIQKRGVLICICASFAATGYIVLLFAPNNTVRLAATCVVAAGVYPINVLSMVWMATNNVGYTFRASTAGLINIVSQLVAITSNFAFDEAPYRMGLTISLALICMSGVSAGGQWAYFKFMNKKKLQQQHSAHAARTRLMSIDEIGNAHPDFFYSY